MIKFFIYLAKNNMEEERDVDMLRKTELGVNELQVINILQREDLLALMKFCGIRTFEDTPVIVCSDEELRMAYVAWRSVSINQRKILAKKLSRKIKVIQQLFIKYMRLEG